MPSSPLSNETKKNLAHIQTVAIAEYALLLRAPLLKDEAGAKEKAETVKYGLASITDFPQNGYLDHIERSIHVHDQIPTAEKYSLQENDVLISIVGSIGRVAIVGQEADLSLPSSNILVVRLYNNSPQNAIFCAMFYKSLLGQSILRDLTHGTTIPLISKKRFAATPFPAFTDENLQAGLSLFELETLTEQRCRQLHHDIHVARLQFLQNEQSSLNQPRSLQTDHF